MALKKNITPDPNAELYNDMLAELKANSGGSGGNVQYLKRGDTTIKLLVPEGRTIRNFYQAYADTDQKGQERKSYLIAAVIVEADDDSVVDEKRVRYIKVTSTTLEHIITHLQSRWPLFEVEGPVFTITKLDGKPWYRGMAQRDVEFDAANVEFPDMSIEEAAENEAQKAADKASSNEKPRNKKSRNDGEDLPF